MGRVLHRESCPRCGSRDNVARYEDGGAKCFGFNCGYWEPPSDAAASSHRRTMTENTEVEFKFGIHADIENRGLTKATCERWGYQVNEDERCHIANYKDATGRLVAQKIRRAGKKFSCVNGGKDMPLYGMWLWGKGKSVVITEGEIDAMSVSQAFEHKWPVVSIPNGADSAEHSLKLHYEWLDRFEKIVLMFDQDEPGRKAAELAATVLPLGKVHIAVLPHKDANEVLLKDGKAAIVSAYWNAKPWRPDGIISGADFTLKTLKTAVTRGFELSMPELHNRIMGLRKGELTLLTAGSGIGKSTWARQLAYELHQRHGLSIGNVFLEEPNAKTAQAYVALHNQVALSKLRYDPAILTDAQWTDGLKVVQERMWFYNHFGSLESANLIAKLRYMATVCGVDFIFLDHISIVTSGMESSSEGERKDIDILMTRLASLVQETGVGIVAIVHLKRVQNKVFNEGASISLNDLRGSASLEQLSFNVLALERDQQADGEERDATLIRVLKCRETGDTGPADRLIFNRETGWLELPKIIAL